MILSFHPCITADHQIILGHRDPDFHDSIYIARSELIILPQTCSEKLYTMCSESSADIFPDYTARFGFPGKTGQNILFNKSNLPQPVTYIWDSVTHFRAAFERHVPHNFPFILKEDRSHESDGIYIINDRHDIYLSLKKIEEKYNFKPGRFISQEFIHSDGKTLRVVVMGDRFTSYWKSITNPDQKLSSINKGAMVDFDWRPDLQKKGIDIVKELSFKTCVNLAAIDIIFPLDQANPDPLLLEINFYFGRKGLGGSINYYRLLFGAISEWMDKNGHDSKKIKLV